MAHVSTQSIRRLPIVRLGLTAAAGVIAAGAMIITNQAPRPLSEITVDQRIMIDKILSVLLHDSDVFQYGRVLDQYDGRGYIAGVGTSRSPMARPWPSLTPIPIPSRTTPWVRCTCRHCELRPPNTARPTLASRAIPTPVAKPAPTGCFGRPRTQS